MSNLTRRRVFAGAAALAIGLGAFVLMPDKARGQAPAEVKTAAQVYKNITVLKDIPADQLNATMSFISASLGVSCDFCHVADKPEADDKGAKRTTRQMISMQMAINKDSFNGRPQVTCYSCHRGATRPVAIPPVLESDAARPASNPAAPAGARPPAPPSADSILEKYIGAVGGADAIRKVQSRILKGVIQNGGSETPTEILAKAPNKRLSISHASQGDSFTAYDGTIGWMGSAARAREMAATDAAGYAIDAEFYFPLRIKELFPQLRAGRAEQANGVECDVLTGTSASRMQVRLYFAKDSGLLTRLIRYTETPLGRMPVQIDYADYRDAGGVRIPFKWTLSRPAGRFTTVIKDVQINPEIADDRFAKPAAK